MTEGTSVTEADLADQSSIDLYNMALHSDNASLQRMIIHVLDTRQEHGLVRSLAINLI